MSGSIRLHPEHGVNPSVGVCFWCGKDDGTVILAGASYKGRAPHRMIVSYEPCDGCKQRFAQGITLVEVTEHPSDQRQAISRNPDLYPTGRYMVLKESAFKRIFTGPIVEATLEHRRAYIDVETFEKLSAGWEGNGQAGNA